MLLAPFWTLGARGHALVWVSFGMCAALYAAVALGVWRFVRGCGGRGGGLFAAGSCSCIAPFAWASLSGMEVAFASGAARRDAACCCGSATGCRRGGSSR